MKEKITVTKLCKMGMLVALAVVFVAIIHIPLIPSVPFLEYDPADIPILLGTFAFGPVVGLILTVSTSLIQGWTVSALSGPYGIIMHIIATGVLSLVAGSIYRYHKEKTKKHAIIGLLIGSISMVIVMIFANILITPLFLGISKEELMPLMPGIILFNMVKAGINSVVTFLVYKRVSPFLHKS